MALGSESFSLMPQALQYVSLFLANFFSSKTAAPNNHYIYTTYIYTFMLIFSYNNTLNKRYKDLQRKLL